MKYIMRILIISAFSIMLIATYVKSNTSYNCDLVLTSEKSNANRKDIFRYKIEATNIKAETGIITFETILEYDENEFEIDFEDETEWSKTGNIGNYVLMVRKDLLRPSTKNQEIGIINIKAKNIQKNGEYKIKLKNIKFGMESEKSFNIPDKTINIQMYNKEKELTSEKIENEIGLQIFKDVIIGIIILLFVLIITFYFMFLRR